MKTILFIAAFSASVIGLTAQTTSTTATLLPDQNPNYQKSRDKYVDGKGNDLTAKEGQTIQQTYKAIDDVQAKQDRKALASQRRQDRRMARIQSRNRGRNYTRSPYGSPYGSGYSPNYYNGYSNPYGYSSPYYYSNNIYGNINSTLNTALLGVALWSLLKK